MITWNYKTFLSNLPIEHLRHQIIHETTPDDWEMPLDYQNGKKREEIFKEHHSGTKSIAIIFESHGSSYPIELEDLGNNKVKYVDNYEKFWPAIIPILRRLVNDESITEGELEEHVLKCMLVVLRRGSEIKEHVDASINLINCRRVHVPIITNEDVIFTVNGTSVFLEEGTGYEINNQELHSVVNNSPSDRVHLIVDFDLSTPYFTEHRVTDDNTM
jgi:hypothetical protein